MEQNRSEFKSLSDRELLELHEPDNFNTFVSSPIDGIKWNERPNIEGGSALVNNAAGGKEVGGRPIACLLAIVQIVYFI